jgi:hypothetical protein
MFSDTDFVIEFIGRRSPKDPTSNSQPFQAIRHSSSSFCGALEPDNVCILAVYFRKTPLDYSSHNFLKHLKIISQQVPKGTKFYQYSSCSDSFLSDLGSTVICWGGYLLGETPGGDPPVAPH